jgi:hypothetical protein
MGPPASPAPANYSAAVSTRDLARLDVLERDETLPLHPKRQTRAAEALREIDAIESAKRGESLSTSGRR